jgi:hypothetical protein
MKRFPKASLVPVFLSEQEPLFSMYQQHLDALNKIINDVGEPLEGNIFYEHLDPHRTQLTERFFPKRAALAMFAMAHDNIVEIGFNSGFSALLMLTANPDLKLTSVDICEHKYTQPCFEYLSSMFSGRINLVKGDSTEVLAGVLEANKDLTGYIIDGGHGLITAEKDLRNVLLYANSDAVLCFDDSDFVELRMMLNLYMMSGHIEPIADPYGPTQNQTQMFFKLVAKTFN